MFFLRLKIWNKAIIINKNPNLKCHKPTAEFTSCVDTIDIIAVITVSKKTTDKISVIRPLPKLPLRTNILYQFECFFMWITHKISHKKLNMI